MTDIDTFYRQCGVDPDELDQSFEGTVYRMLCIAAAAGLSIEEMRDIWGRNYEKHRHMPRVRGQYDLFKEGHDNAA